MAEWRRRLPVGYGTVVVVVLVVVVVVGGGGQGSQTLPPPVTTTPPSAVQVVASCAMRDVDVVQSAAVSQASEASLLHTPALVPSPGIGSLHVPRSYVQQRTVSLPQVERAAHRAPSRMAEGHGAGFGPLVQRASWVQAMFGLASHPSVVG